MLMALSFATSYDWKIGLSWGRTMRGVRKGVRHCLHCHQTHQIRGLRILFVQLGRGTRNHSRATFLLLSLRSRRLFLWYYVVLRFNCIFLHGVVSEVSLTPATRPDDKNTLLLSQTVHRQIHRQLPLDHPITLHRLEHQRTPIILSLLASPSRANATATLRPLVHWQYTVLDVEARSGLGVILDISMFNGISFLMQI
jgi:hypothetical protein